VGDHQRISAAACVPIFAIFVLLQIPQDVVGVVVVSICQILDFRKWNVSLARGCRRVRSLTPIHFLPGVMLKVSILYS
jgi:hypothetical protein